MENQAANELKDEYLHAAKRELQERSRTSVRIGERTQEEMLFIAPSIVRGATFRRRSDEF
jgi:hypothetical protein